MRNDSIVGCVLAGLLVFSACGSSGGGGTSSTEAVCGDSSCGPESEPTPNVSPDSPLTCGAGTSCPDGYRCIDDPASGCDVAEGGDCRGLCVLGEDLPSCGAIDGEACPEGTVCVDDPADDCAGGPAADCPGICQPMADGACTADDECPVPRVPCAVCADGSLSCVEAHCVDGGCVIDSQPCPEPQLCGGVSGLGCEPGFRCVDDPSDDCLEERGDADCPGICLPEPVPPECGGFDGNPCPPGFDCVDNPDDGCDPRNGGVDCPGICEVVPGDECVSDEDCPELDAPCGVCADGSSSCPRSVCQQGRCGVVFNECPLPGGCQTDGDCGPGERCEPQPSDACDPATGVPCTGVCVPEDGPRPCGGLLGDTCPPDYQCVDDPNDDCDPEAGGADCPGVCVLGSAVQCVTDRECATIDLCLPCPDGSSSCASAKCVEGKCSVAYEPCSDSSFCGGVAGFPCPPGLTCVDDSRDDCDPEKGGADCPGVCVPGSPGECTSDGDCAVIQTCRTCPDGSFSCPAATCVNGTCTALDPPCPPPDFCGGIAGFPCPPGFTCIDDDRDDCDPNQGGADCGGVCIRESGPTKCGGLAGEQCAEGYECVDVPDDCDPTTNGDCTGYCRPAQSPNCATDSDCPALGMPCLLCEDGTSACPRSYCQEGACRVDFPGCPTKQPDQ